MNRRTINAVILIGVLSIISILMVQGFWIKRTVRAQKDAVVLQKRQDSLNTIKFEEAVTRALKDVDREIKDYLSDKSGIYGTVKQEGANYFLVDVTDNVPSFYLEQLLKRAFYKHNIAEDFQYGVYNCFNDSIVFLNFVHFTKDSLYESVKSSGANKIEPPAFLKNEDGHFFYVYFPDLSSQHEDDLIVASSPWLYFAIIVGVLLVFFAYSIGVIIKQKKFSEVRTDFINNMTHELKTPISTIALTSEMLMNANFSDDQERWKKYSEIIFKENKRLEQQVERVLNMAKLDRNDLELQLEEINVHDVIVEITENFSANQTLMGGNITLKLDAQDILISADNVHFTNILINLLDNAVKYSEETPEITVATKNKNSGVEISVEDKGIGIAKDELHQIFEQFYRVSTGNLHDVKGFGLGLYYVHLIINKHGGKIKVQSKLGKGTTFCIWLPNI